MKTVIADGQDTSVLDDCWLPGIVLDRSGIERKVGCSDLPSKVSYLISSGKWDRGKINDLLGEDCLFPWLDDLPLFPELPNDFTVWGEEMLVRPKLSDLYRAVRKDRPSPLAIQVFLRPSKLWIRIKIFLWKALIQKLPTDELALKVGLGDGYCRLCGLEENLDHLFFECSWTAVVGSTLESRFAGWSGPRSWADVWNSCDRPHKTGTIFSLR